MIPQYPAMRPIALADKAELDAVTQRFPPYSDFTFVNLWSWDADDAVLISMLNGNIAIRFADYQSQERLYMFIGAHDASDTALQIIRRAEREGINPQLELIPACVASTLDGDTLYVVDQAEHSDYIVSVEGICSYQGQAYKLQRNFVRRFRKEHASVRFEALDIEQPSIRAQIDALFCHWQSQKHPSQALADCHEYWALRRSIEHLHSHLMATGLYAGPTLIAVWIGEDMGNGYAISHFEKGDTAGYVGIIPHLRQQTALVLAGRGVRFINLEQDLGIPGLRQSKRSYAPVRYLRKYRVMSRAERRPDAVDSAVAAAVSE